MGDRGNNRHGPLSRRSWVPVKHNVAWAEVSVRTKWRLHPSSRLDTMDMNRKLGAAPLLVGAAPLLAGSCDPSNTTSPGPRFTSVASGILNGKDVTVNGYYLTKLTGQSFVRWIQQAAAKPPNFC